MPRSPSDFHSLLQRLTALNDPVRLRILRLLDREELSVGELARALQMPQSTVSRHLKLLHDGGWTTRRAEGTASLFRVSEALLIEESRKLWLLAREQMQTLPGATFGQDDLRLAGVLAERSTDSRTFFGRVAGEWDHLRNELFGEGFTPEALLGLLDPEWVVADLGCGTGNIAEHLAPYVRKVIAIDREAAMLESARKRLKDRSNVDFRAGELADPPLRKNEIHAAIIALVLHHLETPVDAMRGAARALKAGGVLLIVDMVSHDRTSYHHTMGHRHLGFSESDIQRLAGDANLSLIRYRRLRPDTSSSGPGTFVALLRK